MPVVGLLYIGHEGAWPSALAQVLKQAPHHNQSCHQWTDTCIHLLFAASSPKSEQMHVQLQDMLQSMQGPCYAANGKLLTFCQRPADAEVYVNGRLAY